MAAQRGKGHQKRPGYDASQGPIAELGLPTWSRRLGLQFSGKTTLQTPGHRPRGLSSTTDAFDFFLRKFERSKLLNAATDESLEERLGFAYLIHVRVRVVTLAHAGDCAAIRAEGDETFRRPAVTGDVVGLRRCAHGETQQAAGCVERAQARAIRHHAGGVCEQEANLIERDRLGKTKRWRRAGEPLLDALGNGVAGQRGPADALDFWRSRLAGPPADEGPEEAWVAFHLLDMFLGVARTEEFKSGDGAPGVERDEQVVRAGIADDTVGLWRSGEQATDGIAASVRYEMQTPRGITKLNPVCCWKKLARLSNGEGRAVLGLAPARLLANENQDDQQHACAVKAQDQRRFQHLEH